MNVICQKILHVRMVIRILCNDFVISKFCFQNLIIAILYCCIKDNQVSKISVKN